MVRCDDPREARVLVGLDRFCYVDIALIDEYFVENRCLAYDVQDNTIQQQNGTSVITCRSIVQNSDVVDARGSARMISCPATRTV